MRDVETHRKAYSDAYPTLRIYQPSTNKTVETLAQAYADQRTLVEGLGKIVWVSVLGRKPEEFSIEELKRLIQGEEKKKDQT